MVGDARISTALPSHPKTKKLIRRLGPAGGWSLVCLFVWAASNRSSGELSGMSDEDIELAADWSGEEGALVRELVQVRFLDGTTGNHVIHDWAMHNPWASGAEMRSWKARWNAIKGHHGEGEADRLVPEYAAARNASSNADSTKAVGSQHAEIVLAKKCSSAPSPSPSPSPSPTPVSEPIGSGGADAPVARAARKCPVSFCITDEMRAWASGNAPLVDMTTATAAFRDHTFKNAIGDWLGAWRNWLRKDQQYAADRISTRRPTSHTGLANKDYSEGITADGTLV